MNGITSKYYIVYGLIMIGKGPIIHFLGEVWTKFELEATYTEKQPFWVWIVGAAGFLLIIYTWYMHFTSDVQYSLVITLIVTLTVVKISQVLFKYRRFREFAVRVTTKDKSALTAMNIAPASLEVLLLLLGICVY